MLYRCPTHHDQAYGKPGKCPNCGRYLVIVQEAEPAKSASDLLVPEGFDPLKFKKLPTPAQNMLKRMSSSRMRSLRSLTSYAETAVRFFDIIGGARVPAEQDWHDYFMVRRRQHIKDQTLRTEFYHLKKLAEVNHYRWPFGKLDVPHTFEEPYVPVFSVQQIEQLVKAWPGLATTERFYLAVSTVWGLRVNEMVSIKKRDYNTESILFHKSHKEKDVRRLIPDELKALFLVAHPSLSSKSSASDLFARICKKAGVPRERRQSWHSIRHTLTSVLLMAVAKNDLDGSLVGEFMSWAKGTIGATFGGSPMVGVYRRNEAFSQDPFWLDRQILPIHPFLKLWKGVTPQQK
jgi:Heavy metal binding domain